MGLLRAAQWEGGWTVSQLRIYGYCGMRIAANCKLTAGAESAWDVFGPLLKIAYLLQMDLVLRRLPLGTHGSWWPGRSTD